MQWGSQLVFDEAHHLRREWWAAAMQLKSALQNPIVVALTATPPYDSEHEEWGRYQELCGPIDAEVSVPELVLQGDLCPHQDYVYFSLPRQVEAEKLREYEQELIDFTNRVTSSSELREHLSRWPWVISPEENLEAILNDPSFFSSILVYLKSAKINVPRKALKVLGVNQKDLPALNKRWLEVLLKGLLFTYRANFSGFEGLSAIEHGLRKLGVLVGNQVSLSDPKFIRKMLASSISKLDAITEIARMERDSLGGDLRMVILSDFIRSNAIPSHSDDIPAINTIGVLPIFEQLRRARIADVKLGVLTGSIVIIPVEAKECFDSTAQAMKLDRTVITYREANFDKSFLRLEFSGAQRQDIVRLVTEVFGQGGITVLVGTQALLGEGWDAPSINTLILASNVGSYMLSNQMRGRAIRTDPARPLKTANIWHLAAVDPMTLTDKFHAILRGDLVRSHDRDPLPIFSKILEVMSELCSVGFEHLKESRVECQLEKKMALDGSILVRPLGPLMPYLKSTRR